MKDKNTLIGFVLIGLVLVAFSLYNKPSKAQLERERMRRDSIVAIQRQNDSLSQVMQEKAMQDNLTAMQADSTSAFFGNAQDTENLIVLHNNLVTLTLSSKGAQLKQAVLAEYKDQEGQDLTMFNADETTMSFMIDGRRESIRTADLYFQPMEVTDTCVTFRMQTNGYGYLDFHYALLPDSYMLNLTIKANGMQQFFASDTKQMIVNWQQRMRQQEKGFSFENRYTSLNYKRIDKSSDNLSEMREKKKTLNEPVDWVAFKGQFFSTVLMATNTFDETYLHSTPLKEGTGYLKQYEAEMKCAFDPMGATPTTLQFFVGPNHFKTLRASNKLSMSDRNMKLQNLVYLGWPGVNLINRIFVIPLFDWLTRFDMNMGLVILLMTLIVKLLVYPTTYKSYISSAKMRVLKPFIEEVSKKYPDPADSMQKQQETMKVYSDYGVSPMGGCLPMLLQMPVFMALFFFLPNAIELRQQSFLWAADLSTYDAVISWPKNIWLIGNHVSLFCLLFSATNLINTWYNMRQQDTGAQPQMAGMKLMMYMMPVMFIFIFNGYSSGLNYYYFISGLMTIVTMILLRKCVDDKKLLQQLKANKERIAKERAVKGTSRGGLMSKLEALQKEQERLQAERNKQRGKSK